MAGTGRPMVAISPKNGLLLVNIVEVAFIVAILIIGVACYVDVRFGKAAPQLQLTPAQQQMRNLEPNDLILTKQGEVYMLMYLHNDRTLAQVSPCEGCDSKEVLWDPSTLANEAARIIHRGEPQYPKLHRQWLNHSRN